MKKLFLLFSIHLLWVTPAAAQNKTDLENGRVFGKVKTVRVERAKLNNDGERLIEKPRILLAFHAFDNSGYAIEQRTYNPDGSPVSKTRWAMTYDTEDREVERYFYNERDVAAARSVSVYNEKGQKAEVTTYCPLHLINHIQTFAYDEKGNKILEVIHSGDGSLRSKISYAYDNHNNLIEVVYMRPDETVRQRDLYSYDDQSNRLGMIIFDYKNTPVINRRYKPDGKGNRIENAYYDGGETLKVKETLSSYEFDDRGNWVKVKIAREIYKGDKTITEADMMYRSFAYFGK